MTRKNKPIRERIEASGLPQHLIDMYRTLVVWYDLDDLDRVRKAGVNLHKVKEYSQGAGALCHDVTIDGFRYQFIGLRYVPNPNQLLGRVVHENVHAINNIWRHAGVRPDLDNDEHQAYFAEDLAYHGFMAASTLFAHKGADDGKKS